MDQQVHDLTILFLKNSFKLSDMRNPADYARKYQEVYKQIEDELIDFDKMPPIVSNRP